MPDFTILVFTIFLFTLLPTQKSFAVQHSNKYFLHKVERTMISHDTTAPTFKRGLSIGHWLAKFDETVGYGAPWFGEQDIRWIAAQGFDHIRFPVDGRLWLKEDGNLDEEKIAVFDRALQLTKANHMSVVLDMHFLPAGIYNKDNQDQRLFTDDLEQQKATNFLAKVARRFISEGDALRFELINEPMAPKNSQLNKLNTALISAVRSYDKKRVLYITSNLSSTFETLSDVIIPNDSRVALLLHYDEPSIFTHQKTPWKDYPEQMPVIHFPGEVPDLSHYLKPDHYAYKMSGKQLSIAAVDADFARAASWIKQHAADKEVYLGAFGVYQKAPEESRRIYANTIRKAAEKYNWGWCIWDYKSSFGIRLADNSTTKILDGLFDKQ